MEKNINIDGTSYNLVYKGKTARLYREQFQEDLVVSLEFAKYRYENTLKEYVKLHPDASTTEFGIIVLENVGEDLLCKITWACIKASSKNKKVKDYEKFIDSIDDYYGFIVNAQLLFVEIIKSNESTVEQEDVENSEDEEDKKKLN